VITREADYGMRIVLALSREWTDGERKFLSVSAIARGMQIPYRFLRKIARRMVTNGLIESRRGKFGGLRLARPPSRISVLDVVQIMDPDSMDLSACARNPVICERFSGCPIAKALAEVQMEVTDRLSRATFDTLAACEKCAPPSKILEEIG